MDSDESVQQINDGDIVFGEDDGEKAAAELFQVGYFNVELSISKRIISVVISR